MYRMIEASTISVSPAVNGEAFTGGWIFHRALQPFHNLGCPVFASFEFGLTHCLGLHSPDGGKIARHLAVRPIP